MEKVRKKLIPTNVVSDWIAYNGFAAGTYITLPTDDPENTLVLYVMMENIMEEEDE